MPAQYDLDPAVIERAFFERSKELHVDKFATAAAAERVAALSKSRALNDAYQTLKKPMARAEYLLARNGVAIGDNERLEPEFLMRVLELREELAEAKVAGDRPTLERLHVAMTAQRDARLAELVPLFATGSLADVKRVVVTLRYIMRYLEECDAALDED